MTRVSRRLVVVISALLLASATYATMAPASAAPSESFRTLQPGKPPRLTEKIPVQVVMLGYERDMVPEEWFREYLPNVARPVDRSRGWRAIARKFGDDWTWGTPGVAEMVEELGLEYSFDHHVVYTEPSYEDTFFQYLTSIGVDEAKSTGNDVSLFQYLYNQQPGRALDISHNLVINADAVERWLVEHPAPGIDPARNTVVLVNWWGRPDFRFHEYTPTGEAQSETGVNFPQTYWSGRQIAFGGTSARDETGSGRPSRTWFHDLSAGPDFRTGNWVIDDTLGGYGPDPSWQTIFPPIWEYALGRAQDRWALPDALGAITRFVAIDIFFAASPIYGHDTDAQMNDDVELDLTVYGNKTPPRVTPSLLKQKVGRLLGADPKVDVQSRPFTGTPAKCHQAFVLAQRCRPETDPAVYPVDADYFVAAEQERPRWQDRSSGYEAPGFVYDVDQARKFIGIADDNWTEGARSAVHSVVPPSSTKLGYGTTSVLVHEYGHHFGVSHPHDGYETEWGPVDFSANSSSYGVFYFAWVGAEVNSVMSYLNVNNDFSQFDVDNYQRYQAIRHLRAANMIAAQVQGSPQAAAGAADLARADAAFTAAQAALEAHDYVTTMAKAADGYRAARAAAKAAGVTVPTVDPFAMTAPGSWQAKQNTSAVAPATEPVSDVLAGTEAPPAVAGIYTARRG